MTFQTKRKIVLILALVFALATGFILLVKVSSPKFNYEIKSQVIDDAKQLPLKVTAQEDSILLETKFYDLKGNFETAQMRRKLKFQPSFPFLVVDPNITVILRDNEFTEEEIYVYYEIFGAITNLNPGEYRITMEDGFGNLIDETFVEIK
ncbi:MAG: hypothetical protein UU64_C0002G0099 [candidate division WWE3 bacterium GW2011_GWF2_41_45]|uniref:Uncharacterized protein n=3 Tax=Katanobacteria TaxID=422282 RepID=A0A1F4W305_UNCKA|nr:MAG: hypothetical protein UU55_C0001G0019 [candidate division WWE3 bacterium GW2011_GWC2_41_23]KKS10697.1 MAG: hypothetical protein UU64_C0002G0099 [candidate division WWE3 bacterium GW2011_GWF2_41_45]KKS12292.1 MAG: hypothetical protein UU68_C0002G0018 [candidate division WWE3 bacterium GW2011_GWF1_41_53]KKS20365.1 MAG: hypothetical protein UU79_C0001G0019 [candidate division WWE3 bacterium GW2011_GWE1_41_72]KKS28762.1 MAG: hypothetical protein UU90_C0018G0020 [candidate division WWE3 bacte